MNTPGVLGEKTPVPDTFTPLKVPPAGEPVAAMVLPLALRTQEVCVGTLTVTAGALSTEIVAEAESFTSLKNAAL